VSAAKICTECGAVLAADAADTVCPRCAAKRRVKENIRQRIEAGSSASPSPSDAPTVTAPAGSLPSRPPGTKASCFGDYELLEEISHGGMGVVWKARQISLNRPVALKMILGGQLATPEDVRRFRVEAEATAKLDHPNIVPIYEVGEHEGQHYFSMRLVEGSNLAKKAAIYTKDQTSVARLMLTVARAVQHAHEHGILHRDLKPSNILLDTGGQPHVTDFGLAKRVDVDSSLTQTGAVLGTPNYMAPEQARGMKDLTVAVDVYALGAILYELLTGQPPFRSENVLETLRQVIEEEPVRPQAINPQTDPSLETICLKCLEKNPKRRYESAKALADDLTRFLNQKRIRAKRGFILDAAKKGLGRRKSLVALGVFAALAAVGLLATWVIVLQSRAREGELATARARADATIERDAKVKAEREVGALQNHAREAELAADKARVAIAAERDAKAKAEGEVIALRNRVREAELTAEKVRVVTAADQKSNVKAERDKPRMEAALGKAAPHIKTMGVLLGHDGWVGGVTFSPDGKRIATTSEDGTVKIWDAIECTELLTLAGHTGWVGSVAFSPDGTRLASTSKDQTVRVWEASSGKQLFAMRGHTKAVHAIAFSPDGKRIASSSSDETVRLWDAITGLQLRSLATQTTNVYGVAFSPDGRRLASAVGKTVRVWNTTSGEQVLSLTGQTENVHGIAYSPDAKQLAAGSSDATVVIWDATGSKQPRVLRRHTKAVWGIAFSPDGKQLASGSNDRTAKIWNVATGSVLLTLRGHGGEVLGVAFSPDGKRLVSASSGGIARIWNVSTGSETQVKAKPAKSR